LKGPVTETLEQENRLARLQSEIASTERSLNQTVVLAPSRGVITTLEVRGAGAVVQAGQRIATIAPSDARLVVEARVLNKDIALVKTGMPVKLKFDAFPFQDYGTLPANVIEVSPDSQTGDMQESFYKVKIKPQQSEFALADRVLPIRTGLAVTAEIITERR